MEANRVESERCIEIAERCLREGNKDKALKFLHKAERLCSSEKAQDLIRNLEASDCDDDLPNGSASGDYSAYEHYSDVRFRSSKSSPNFDAADSRASAGKKPSQRSKASAYNEKASRERSTSASRNAEFRRSESQPQVGAEYSAEQLEAVQRVRRSKDYYETLGLAKDFTESDLKKAYRKFALLLHPDKNQAPGAAEAFKSIGNAYACLSDAEKRKRYDMYGTDNPTARRDSGAYDDYSHGFEAEFSPEEIFNMFFGGGFPSGAVYRRRTAGGRTYYEHQTRHHHHFAAGQQPAEEQRQENSLSVLLQLMPILILVILSLFSSFLIGEPAYSMHRNNKYSIERKTSDLKVPYYVKSDFLKQFSGSIGRVEQQVEDDYISNLRSNCFREKSQSKRKHLSSLSLEETLMWRARTYGDAHLYEKAQRLQTPSCDRLAEIYA